MDITEKFTGSPLVAKNSGADIQSQQILFPTESLSTSITACPTEIIMQPQRSPWKSNDMHLLVGNNMSQLLIFAALAIFVAVLMRKKASPK